MPAQRLRKGSMVSILKFDVAGQDSDSETEFVRHVGLCDEGLDGLSPDNASILMVHMGPPLGRDGTTQFIQTVGSAALTADQIRQIDLFIRELELEYMAEKTRTGRQHVISPHVREPDDRCSCRRFSCAGFVIEAYRDAGIELLITAQETLPKVSLETLEKAYPDQQRILGNPATRARLGLEGTGPWPVLLAGYVVNSLSRSSEQIRRGPYAPSQGDEYFPPRQGAQRPNE